MEERDLYPEDYLKGLVQEIVPGVDWQEASNSFKVGEHHVVPDGQIGSEWAVELEARTLKQIRGALVDLELSAPKSKLLVVLFKGTATMSESSVQGHLEEVVTRLEFDSERWCIVALNRQESREVHLARLRSRLGAKGLGLRS